MASDENLDQPALERVFLSRATRRDERAFAALASIHSDEVYSIARNLCSSDAEALELTEKGLQRAWSQMSTIAAEEAFFVFVCRFLVCEAVARLRSAQPSAPRERLDLPVQRSFAAGSEQIARLARRRDVREHLDAALAALDPHDRAAFVLRIVQGLSIEDSAAILGVEPSIVRRRSHCACLLVTAFVSQLAAHPAGAGANHAIWFQ